MSGGDPPRQAQSPAGHSSPCQRGAPLPSDEAAVRVSEDQAAASYDAMSGEVVCSESQSWSPNQLIKEGEVTWLIVASEHAWVGRDTEKSGDRHQQSLKPLLP